MMTGKRLSIKLKLTLIAAVTSTLSLLVASAGFIYYDLSTFKTKMKSDLATEAQVIGANCGAPLVFGDSKALSETVSSLRAQRDIRTVAVYAPDGSLVAEYARLGARDSAPNEPKAGDRAYFSGDSLKVFRTIYSDQDAVGTLYIESDLHAWYERRNRFLAIVAPLVGACVVISLILGSRLQRIISRPVLELVETTRQVSSLKRYDIRAKKLADDEVGQLVDGFNAMLSEIEARDQEVHHINEVLEERVRSRTIQLEEQIVERQLAQEEVSKSQQVLDDFFENAAIGLDLVGPDGVIRRANRAELEMLGYSKDEYVGHAARNFHADPAVMDELMERLANGEVISGLECTMQSKDGTPKFVAIDANVRWEGDTFLHARCFVRDLTAHKEADRMRIASELAERSNQAKSEFLSRMSHELRTPMNSILGFSQLLELDDLTADQIDSVRQIISAGKHLLRLINEVLDISRIESGNLSVSIEPVDAFEVLNEVVGFVQPLAAARSITIHVPEGEASLFVIADGQRLRQILINLFSNAIKYNIQAGAITVTVERRADRVRFNVIDTGHGIARDRAEQLFIPFQRLGAEATAVEGTGLGLALSLRLAEAMGGTVGLEPSSTGSHFFLELGAGECPVARFDELVGPISSRSSHSASKNLSVLLIEDNSANVRLVEKSLQHFKLTTLRVATSGRHGIEAAKAEIPDLVLLDLNLPDINGLEVLQALKADPRTARVPVVVTSADASPTQIERLNLAGAADYLTKPLDLHALWRTFERCIPGGLEKSA